MEKQNKITKKIYFDVLLSLLPTKNEKNGWKALYIGIEKDITRNVYECFIV